jgi:hemerythrin
MNKENITFYEHCLLESKTIYTSLADYIANVDFAYSDTCNGYLKQYNNIIIKYKAYFDIPMTLFKFENYEFSDSKKTIRDFGCKRLINHIKAFNEFLEKSISDINSSQDIQNIAMHQMRKCLKTGVVGCPKKPDFKKNQVFVGMPFNDKYEDAFTYAIKEVFERNGFSIYRADYSTDTIDIMCKICAELQSSNILIFNISDSNPNVMLEVGLSYGLGKKILLIKDKETKPISDISGIEYIEYTHAGNLQQKLLKFIETLC